MKHLLILGAILVSAAASASTDCDQLVKRQTRALLETNDQIIENVSLTKMSGKSAYLLHVESEARNGQGRTTDLYEAKIDKQCRLVGSLRSDGHEVLDEN